MSSPRELVTDFMDAMARYDTAALAGMLADDVTWWVPPSAAARGIARPLVGRDTVVTLLGGGYGFFEAGSVVQEIDHVIVDGDMVAVTMSRRARTVNGGPYDNVYCLVFRCAGEQVAEAWEHADTAHAFAQFDA
jgi:uncharacterized protein